MEAYFTKIELLVTILTCHHSPVNDNDVVHHKDTFLDLKTARSMLITEEMRLKSRSHSLPVDSSSSSPMVLMAQSSTNRRPLNSQVKSWRPCFNFAKGFCRFGSDCKYVCNQNARNTTIGGSKQFTSTTDELLVKILDKVGLNNTLTNIEDTRQHKTLSSHTAAIPQNPPVAYNANAGSTVTAVQATTLPQAFTVGTLHDPTTGTWNGIWIQDFITRRVLLRCDSTGDLYPVTAPSLIPQLFLVSSHTWHQRLGHPGSDVLRRLVSNNFTSCNKEKPHVFCHACHPSKHVRLPFVNSDTVVNSCFDIIHSDVWTSPILSLLGFNYYDLFFDHYS
ncbi:ribonuclease H-like domain-containing protein [Tanacetum coccineum]